MKTIVITGPSGSGKSFLSKIINKVFSNTIVISTDSYYRDDLIIKLLSIFNVDIYDRLISIKNKEIIKTIDSIINNEEYIYLYNYDFKNKISKRSQTYIKNIKKIDFLIIEGIFAHRLKLNYNKTINIICKEKKNICYKRRLKRDLFERGRSNKEVIKRFSKSWNLYFSNYGKYKIKYKIYTLNPTDRASYQNLISKLKKLSKIKAKGNI